MTGMQELLDRQALWDYDDQGRLRHPIADDEEVTGSATAARAAIASARLAMADPHE